MKMKFEILLLFSFGFTLKSVYGDLKDCNVDFVNGLIECKNAQGQQDQVHIAPLNDSIREEIIKLNPTLSSHYLKNYLQNVKNSCSCDFEVNNCTCLALLGRKVSIPITLVKNSGTSTEATTIEPELTNASTHPSVGVNPLKLCIGDFLLGLLKCMNSQGQYDVIRVTPKFNSKKEEFIGHRSLYQCVCIFKINGCRCFGGIPLMVPTIYFTQNSTTEEPELETSTLPTVEIGKYENCSADFVKGLLNCTNVDGLQDEIVISPLDNAQKEKTIKLNTPFAGYFVDRLMQQVQKECTCNLKVNQCRCGHSVIVPISPYQSSDEETTQDSTSN